jgi:hypothetical protein
MLRIQYKTRINYSEEQKSLLWDRWQKGESKVAGDDRLNVSGTVFDNRIQLETSAYARRSKLDKLVAHPRHNSTSQDS